ncbi:MAG: amidase [Myxococcota bacterium]
MFTPPLTLLELAHALQSGTLNAEAIVHACVQRIRHHDPKLHMLILDRTEAALTEAREVDRRRRDGECLGPLAGLPMTVKDSLDTAGIPTTSACLHRRSYVPTRDASTVARLRAEGFILLGKSSLPELAFGVETANLMVGRTRNPWIASHSVGGSSGGEAALIATGCSPLGLGTDLGGSLRIPAHFTGVCSLKPGQNILPTDGNLIRFQTHVLEFASIGPLASTVTDLALAFAVLHDAPHRRDALLEDAEGLLDGELPSKPIVHLAFSEDPRLSIPCREALLHAATVLKAQDFPVQPHTSEALTACETLWDDFIYSDGIAGLYQGLADGEPLEPWKELLRLLVGRARRHPLPLIVLFLQRHRKPIPLEQTREGIRRAKELLNTHLPPGGVLLTPVTPHPTRHWLDMRGLEASLCYAKPANVLGLTAVTLPIRRGSPGKVPLAVQLMGRAGEEWRVLSVARALERGLRRAEGLEAEPGA